jgi:hypothetical protein
MGGAARTASASDARSCAASRPTLARALGDRLGPAATFATTEHFNLQTARAVTVSEANGRGSISLAARSSNLIALAFIGADLAPRYGVLRRCARALAGAGVQMPTRWGALSRAGCASRQPEADERTFAVPAGLVPR